MMFFEKLKIWRIQRRWNKYGRKDLFTWVHRYLRLHGELLEDPVYQNMYEYHRAALVAYLKKDVKRTHADAAQLGEVADALADIFNRSSADRVNAYKPLIEELHKIWINNHDMVQLS